MFASSMINALVYSEDGAKEAAAAGYILLSMVAVSSLLQFDKESI